MLPLLTVTILESLLSHVTVLLVAAERIIVATKLSLPPFFRLRLVLFKLIFVAGTSCIVLEIVTFIGLNTIKQFCPNKLSINLEPFFLSINTSFLVLLLTVANLLSPKYTYEPYSSIMPNFSPSFLYLLSITNKISPILNESLAKVKLRLSLNILLAAV